MRELIEVIDQLESDLCDVLDEMTNTTENTSALMNRAAHLDWEIRIRTDAILSILREKYVTSTT